LLATEKTNLTTELNTANEILQSIPEQLNEVNEMYSAVTGYNTNSNS
jgi:flagellar hook-associated protein 2